MPSSVRFLLLDVAVYTFTLKAERAESDESDKQVHMLQLHGDVEKV